MKKSQRGFAHLFLVILLLLGVAAGVYLVQNTQLLKSHAGSNPIIFINSDNTKCDPSSSSCSTPTAKVKVELRSTLGPPLSNSTPQLSMQGLQQAFGSMRGDSKYDPRYDVNNDGKINLTDFNTLKRNGSLSASPISAAITAATGTVSYKIAESPTDLDTATYQPYTQEPTTVDYTFKNTTAGQKFLWVEFKDNTGKTERRSAQVTLQPPPIATPTRTPTPTLVSPTPTPLASKRIFVTSTTYTGNLDGLGGADTKCNIQAGAAKLGGIWRAWISDNTTSATQRLNHYNGPYKLINGTKIANNFNDFINSSIPAKINITESGAISNSSVWTNTKKDGSIASVKTSFSNGGHCFNWTSATNQVTMLGVTGNSNQPLWANGWTWEGSQTCGQQAALYCFEQ